MKHAMTVMIALGLGARFALATPPPKEMNHTLESPEPTTLPPRHPDQAGSPYLEPMLILARADASASARQAQLRAGAQQPQDDGGTSLPAGALPAAPASAEPLRQVQAEWIPGRRVTLNLYRYQNVCADTHTITLEGDPDALPVEVAVKWSRNPQTCEVAECLLGGVHELPVPPGHRVTIMVEGYHLSGHLVVRDNGRAVLEEATRALNHR